ncbi:ankyrin repeat domain-containing protein 50 [Microdochium nivale]|nr:ankyrin repeat domain-containing protein 50 [Microdochium nivale]
MKDWTVISFFFNARGEKMEKTVQGLYQSLLLQILTQFPHIQCILHSSQSGGAGWAIASLQDLLSEALRSLGQEQLLCMIDALDECHSDEVRDMVHFFEDQECLAIRYGHCFRVLFASRHYPHITVRKGIKLILDVQEGHERDIANYISDKLSIGNSWNAELITGEVQQKATGIFMWVILVVKMLNEQYDEGANTTTLRKVLQRIPQGLHDLLYDIILRDEKNRENMLLCIQWLLFTKRPLSPVELYFAIHNSKSDTDGILLKRDPEEHFIEQINKFILSASKGLAEIIQPDRPTVQLIHESVNDFLREDGIQQIWSDVGDNFKGKSHERLKSCCLNHISFSRSLLIRSSSRAEIMNESFGKFSEALKFTYPLLKYAIASVLFHADTASSLGISQSDFTSDFVGLREDWVELRNMLEKNIKCLYSPNVSLLYLLAEGDLNHLMRDKPELMSPKACLTAGRERHGPPLFAALARQNDASVTTLIASLQGQDTMRYNHTKQGRHPCEESSLIRIRRTRYDGRIGVLAYLADYGNVHLLDAVFPHVKLQLHNKSNVRGGALSWALNRAVVQFLLRNGACLEHHDEDGRTPLSWAAQYGRQQTVETLLEHGAAFDAASNDGSTPLHFAAQTGHLAVVRTLLKYGAAIDFRDSRGDTALLLAARAGNAPMVQTLLDFGAVIDAGNESGDTALNAAARKVKHDVVLILLRYGAAINTSNQDGNTPLHNAFLSRLVPSTTRIPATMIQAMIQAMVEHSVSIDAKNKMGRTALSLVTELLPVDDVSILNILLASGASVRTRDERGRTPLSWATTRRSEGSTMIVALLVEHHAKVDEQDNAGRTPLSWAAQDRAGNEPAHELLQNGAQIDSQDHSGRTPLSYAVEGQRESTVRLLLDRGAAVHLKDHEGRSALDWARSGDNHEFVQILESSSSVSS